MRAGRVYRRQMTRRKDDYTGFFRAEYPQVLRAVELMLGDRETALDLAQEAFARLYRHWHKACRYDHPGAYVRRIAVNLAISHIRRRRVQEKTLRALSPLSEAEPAYRDPSILEAVRRLPPGQRAATVLFYFEDQPSSEIARILGCSESTARAHLHKARAKLAHLLESHDERRAHADR